MSDFKAKMHQIRFPLGSAPDPAKTALQTPQLYLRGSTSKGMEHWRNFTLESGGDQWRRQDLVSGGTTIEAPKARASRRPRRRVGWGVGRGVRSPAD